MVTKLHWRTALLVMAISIPVAIVAAYRDDDPPNLFRLAVAAILAGLLWWIAECFGVITMRVAAVLGAIGVVLALITVGDNDRANADVLAYESARESVGVELNNLIRVGDAATVDALAEDGDETVEQSGDDTDLDLSDPELTELVVAELADDTVEAPVRARPVKEISQDVGAITEQFVTIDERAARCPRRAAWPRIVALDDQEVAALEAQAEESTDGERSNQEQGGRAASDAASADLCNAREPRIASIQMLAILRDQLGAAQTRTSNASLQEQLGERILAVEAEISRLEQPVAVHHLVIDGADALVGDALSPVVNDDVAARLGGWGWAVVAFALIIGYRRLEIINGNREAGPVGVKRPDESGMSDEERRDSRIAATVMGNFLGQAELREPSTIPGGDATSQVADLMREDGVPGGRTAQAVLNFFQNTAFPAKGVTVTATVERIVERGSDTCFRVTARVSHARNKRLLYAQPFESTDLTTAAKRAAAYVATTALADSRTTLPWARWPDDDGTGLLAYQDVALDERTRDIRLPPVARRQRLETAVASCPYSGLARVGLGQQLQLVGPLANNDAELGLPLEPDALPPKGEVGRALVTGMTHLAWATAEFPEFLIARYRLAASLSMLAEDYDGLWHFDEPDRPYDTMPQQHRAFLGSNIVTSELVDLLTRQSRHRRRWSEQGVLDLPTKVSDADTGLRARMRRRYYDSRFGSFLRPRIAPLDAKTLVNGVPGGNLPDPVASHAHTADKSRLGSIRLAVSARKSSLLTGPSSRRRDSAAIPLVKVDASDQRDLIKKRHRLLQLATIEVETGLWILKANPTLRLWRQAERSYWVSLLLNPTRRHHQRAAFRILGEIIKLRLDTLPPHDASSTDPAQTKDLTHAQLAEQLEHVRRLQAKHRDDAVVCYVAASFCGVALHRMRHGGVEGVARTDQQCLDLALMTIQFIREARAATNGFVVSSRWAMRDPDLWELREAVPVEWDALIRHLRVTEARLEKHEVPKTTPTQTEPANSSRTRILQFRISRAVVARRAGAARS